MTAPVARARMVPFVKKGVMLQEIWDSRQFTAAEEAALVQTLGLGWCYNYLPSWDTSSFGVQFWPMIFKGLQATAPNLAIASAYGTPIMGFNEGYNPDPQANIDPGTAAGLWTTLFMPTGRTLVSPSTAAGTGGVAWLATFESTVGSVAWDYTAVHFYSSTFNDPPAVHAAFNASIAQFFAAYGKRCVVSEFGLLNTTGAPSSWLYPTMAQWAAQLAYSGPRAFADDRIAGFAPYCLSFSSAVRAVNPNSANLTLANLDTTLTLAGQTYQGLVNWP